MKSLLFGIVSYAALTVACSQSDAGITATVKSRLVAVDLVKAGNINVDTRDRIVTLRGQVNSAAEETQALSIARGTRGVADVMDEISVVPQPRESAPTTGINEGPGVTAQATDAGITAAVKATLLIDPDVSGLRINVDTHDRVVTLTGTVRTEAEKSRALEIAREAENVTRIVDRLTVQGR